LHNFGRLRIDAAFVCEMAQKYWFFSRFAENLDLLEASGEFILLQRGMSAFAHAASPSWAFPP